MKAGLVRIAVHDVRAFGRHGANPGEREHPQPFDLDFWVDAELAAQRGDALAGTIDYAALHARVVRIVEKTSFVLLERLGEEILAALLADERVREAGVTIAKPHLLSGATPSVTLSASRRREP